MRAALQPDGTPLGWVSTVRDVSERRRYEAELERLATHDPLTGLANHRLFHQRLAEEMASAVRHGRRLSVAILDLDHFKSINDRYGHVVGDHTLVAVAQRLSTVVREGELLARVGGEEFAWILPGADATGVLAAAERARHVIRDRQMSPIGRLTISIGVATREHIRDASVLFEHADQALYRAKREGRDRTIIWNPDAASVVGSGLSMAEKSKIAYLLERLSQGVAAHNRENPTHHTWGIGMAHFDIERLGLEEGEEILPGIVLQADGGSPAPSGSSATATTARVRSRSKRRSSTPSPSRSSSAKRSSRSPVRASGRLARCVLRSDQAGAGSPASCAICRASIRTVGQRSRWRAPARRTAPWIASSSGVRPAARSRCIEEPSDS